MLNLVLPEIPPGDDWEFADTVWAMIQTSMGVNIKNDDDGVDVRLWVPMALRDVLLTINDKKKVEGIDTRLVEKCVAHPVFIPSHDRAKRDAFLNWGSDVQSDGDCITAVRILVVRHDQYDEYKRYWGKEYLVLQLPRQMTQVLSGESVTVTAEHGKIGFSRYVRAFWSLGACFDSECVNGPNENFPSVPICARLMHEPRCARPPECRSVMLSPSPSVCMLCGEHCRLFCQAIAHGLDLKRIWLVDDNVTFVQALTMTPSREVRWTYETCLEILCVCVI